MVQEAAPMKGCGGVWADLLPEWAEECEEVYHNIKGWTDWMWTRVNDVDAPPQVNSTGKRHSFYVIEFHRAGATQVNLSSNTRRTVRRIEVKMMGRCAKTRTTSSTCPTDPTEAWMLWSGPCRHETRLEVHHPALVAWPGASPHTLYWS